MDNYIIHKTYMGYVAESKDFNNYHLLMAKTLEELEAVVNNHINQKIK